MVRNEKGYVTWFFFQPSPELVPAIQVFLDLNLNVFTSPELSPANRYTALVVLLSKQKFRLQLSFDVF